MPRFSVIIPVYNRIDEVRDLMESLALQSCKDFEVVIVEDGSSAPCKDVVEEYADRVDASYYYKENEGRTYHMFRLRVARLSEQPLPTVKQMTISPLRTSP